MGEGRVTRERRELGASRRGERGVGGGGSYSALVRVGV